MKLEKFLSIPFVKFEEFEELKELLKFKAPCVKIQKPQYDVLCINFK